MIDATVYPTDELVEGLGCSKTWVARPSWAWVREPYLGNVLVCTEYNIPQKTSIVTVVYRFALPDDIDVDGTVATIPTDKMKSAECWEPVSEADDLTLQARAMWDKICARVLEEHPK